MSSMPVLTLVVIVHNQPDLVADIVAAFAKGRLAKSCECLLLDNGSGPDTAKMCREASRTSPAIRLLRHKVMEPAAECRNTGLRAARGSWISYVQETGVPSFVSMLYAVLSAQTRNLTGLQFGSTPEHTVYRVVEVRAVGGWNEALQTRAEETDIDLLARLTQQEHVVVEHQHNRSLAVDVLLPPRSVDIVFIPHKDYHVWTISLLVPSMRALGLCFEIIDITAQWRDDGARSMIKNQTLEEESVKLGALALGQISPRAVVVFNDWDPITRPIILAAQAAGIATVGIVEGIQDYADADVPWSRQAYQAVDVVLLPGAFDIGYFQSDRTGQQVVPVGVARIEALRKLPPVSGGTGRVMINSNFAYGVMIEQRDIWLEQAVETVLAVGLVPVISRHSADRGTLYSEYVTDQDFYSCLETSDATIQRFASGVLESLARAVPVLYFRPYGERVGKFTDDPMGIYPVCDTIDQLQAALTELPRWKQVVAQKAGKFLDFHAGPAGENVATTTATALANACGPLPDAQVMMRFVTLMQGIDRLTHALTKPGAREKALFGTLGVTSKVLKRCDKVANLPPHLDLSTKDIWRLRFPVLGKIAHIGRFFRRTVLRRN